MNRADLLEVTVMLGTEMLMIAFVAKDVAVAGEMLQKKLASGGALKELYMMVPAQGGDIRQPLPVARFTRPVRAAMSGRVRGIACDLGYVVIAPGSGQTKANNAIDFAVRC